MSDYEPRDTDPRLESRGEGHALDTGPEGVKIYDRPETRVNDGGTGTRLWAGLLILIVVAALVVLLLLFLF